MGMENVSIEETANFGKAVVANTDLIPGSLGLEVFREEALIVFPPPPSPSTTSNSGITPPAPWGNSHMLPKRCWPDFQHFLKQSDDIQSKVLSFFVEMECKDALRLLAFASKYIQPLELAKTFVRLTMVIKFNSVIVQPVRANGNGSGRYFGHGLFEVACRMTHSCRPNCVWFSSEDGKSKIVRAITPIKAGSVLSVTYLDPKYLEKPMFVRRQELKKDKNFDCKCERCISVSGGDDARSFRCHNKRCGGHHLAQQVDIDDTPTFLTCSVCHEAAPEIFQNQMLEKEEEARRQIDYVDRVADLGLPIDVVSIIRSLKPPSTHHGVCLPIYSAQFELYLQMNDLSKAILAQRKRINCRLHIHGRRGGEMYQDDDTGFQYERLGDALNMNNDWAAAEKAYQRAVQALQVSRGGSDEPYSRCAMEKLIDVQGKMVDKKGTAASLLGTIPSEKCDLCGMEATKKCGRCGMVVYCNRDHQTFHWKVHKKICKMYCDNK